MLTLVVPAFEGFDEGTEEFIHFPEITLQLEHSLVSISKWESEWGKPFLGPEQKTREETLSYIECMNLGSETPQKLAQRLRDVQIATVNQYIDKKMTATWFREDQNPNHPPSREIITAELVYYWMVALTIPFECQYWHFNKLITLIRVCNEKNKPEKKMSRAEVAAQQRAINAQRKAAQGTRG